MQEDDRKWVMVVEDNAELRDSTIAALEICNYEAAGAENGQAALEHLEAKSVLPCLIFLDLMMPVMNGWQFLQKLQEDPKLARIPVIVVSALVGSEQSIPHVVDCLPKPLSIDQLIKVLPQHCC